MTKMENEISTYRKVTEMIGELKEAIKSLEAQQTTLRDNILSSLKKADYNVCRYKALAMGTAGRNLFTVGFGKRIERKSGRSLDDQKWLESLKHFTHTRYVFEKDVLKAALRSDPDGIGGWLKEHDLCVVPSMNLAVQRIPSEIELNALRDEAVKLAEEADANEDAA